MKDLLYDSKFASSESLLDLVLSLKVFKCKLAVFLHFLLESPRLLTINIILSLHKSKYSNCHILLNTSLYPTLL